MLYTDVIDIKRYLDVYNTYRFDRYLDNYNI